MEHKIHVPFGQTLLAPMVLIIAIDFLSFATYGQEKRNSDCSITIELLEPMFKSVEKRMIDMAEAMSADNYNFSPTSGRLKKTFAQHVKTSAANNYILAAASQGQEWPDHAGDYIGPDSVSAKSQIVEYLRGSFRSLDKAIQSLSESNPKVSNWILRENPTRLNLIMEDLT